MQLERNHTTWLLLGSGAALVAGLAARAALKQGWRTVRHTDPPLNPIAADTPWRDALAWAAVSGLTVGLARLAARRGMAAGWTRWAGSPPPI